MFVYYNQQGIGNVLLFPLKNSEKVTFEKYGDIAVIMDESTGEVVGYNIFEADQYISDLTTGKTKLTEDIVAELQKAFEANQVPQRLEIDLTPKFVVGYVKEISQHEDADKLRVCQVDVGSETLQIVCGAPNVDQGQKVVVAKVGAIMPSGLEIKPTKLRGVDSFGMICSQKELGLPNAPQEKGIYVLPAEEEIGNEFLF
ncbi:YtpR family tRNA-binding protein [Gracilibacillus alcaliphilus]|uniref:YtpR family tRNA-binding protein n=1 Tax=Gracilibacillus alcaliphilus TaxID=1401441 RepID=UPI00195B068F|nr:DUF4479 family protein [Gracilibacillus alcaliphilus]MBM7679468.1 tRNA-binding protein [Gracilibacillus alcaliphilus]